MIVDFRTCKRELIDRGGVNAHRIFGDWLKRPGYEAVHSHVMGFQHKYLYELSIDDVRAVLELPSSDRAQFHALGDVQRYEDISCVADFDTPFAFQYLFHMYLEEYRKVPNWKEFKGWLFTDAKEYYWARFFDKFDLGSKEERDRRPLLRALQWRLGNSYYASLKELDMMVRLRDNYGVQLRYHILADVLMRCDFWAGDHIVSLFVKNERYRTLGRGRKMPAKQVFKDATPPFQIHDIELETENRYGVVWAVKDSVLQKISDAISFNTK